MHVAIGIPAFNEEKNIASIVLRLKEKYETIIVCDDGSSDLTGNIAKELDTNVIVHKKNLGYGAAIRSIFLKARELKIDILVTFDADGQHRIEDIDSIIKPIEEDKADIVIGSRFLENDSKIPKYRKAGIKTITGLTNVATGLDVSDSQSGFRSYNKKTLQEINPTDFGMGVSTEILIKAKKINLKILEIPIVVLYEGDTSTHNPVSHGASVILSTMKYVSIERPLSFYGIPGMILFCIGIFFSVWTLQIFSESRQIITNIALIGMGGLVLGMLGIMTAVILYSTVSVVREKS
jgi:glycosyltransferase involved in cell wall biosynthesis